MASEIKRTKVLIVGSGGNGVSPAVLLKRAGVDVTIITKHSDFGGCWHQNRYPGCATDTRMLQYQFDYAFTADWSGTHASREELAAFIRKVAADNGLYEVTDFETELLSARWLEERSCWKVTTNKATYHADLLLPATGFLEEPIVPTVPGLEGFAGRAFHSSLWPEGYSGAGDRIAVVGTGSSSLQIVPALQKIAEKLYVFQRTPNHIIPRNYRAFSNEQRAGFVADPAPLLAERAEYVKSNDSNWINQFLGQDQLLSATAAQNALRHLKAQVPDPVLRAKLTPAHTFACKRPGSSDDFYPALQRPNVELVTAGVAALDGQVIRATTGEEFEVDTVVFATGFYFGGHILDRIMRRDGVSVGTYQKGHPRAYKSVSVAGCPNVFLIGGAGPNGQIWNGFAPGEVVPRYVLAALDYMDRTGVRALEVNEEAELTWKREADAFLSSSPAAAGTCVNYSQDALGRNKAAWPGNHASYEAAMMHFDADAYHVIESATVAAYPRPDFHTSDQ